jgi:hypothetical protein
MGNLQCGRMNAQDRCESAKAAWIGPVIDGTNKGKWMRRPDGMGRWMVFATITILMTTQSVCVASQNASAEGQQAIRSIYVDATVAMPKEPILVMRAQGFAAAFGGVMGGALGGAAAGGISASSGGTPTQQFLAYLNDNHIRVDEMLPAAFVDEVEKGGLFQIAASLDEADAVLKLEVRRYGLGYTANPFSHDYRASLYARATLTRASGKVVWSKRVWEESAQDQWPAASMHDLFAQPELMRAQMAAAANAAAHELVVNLRNTKL